MAESVISMHRLRSCLIRTRLLDTASTAHHHTAHKQHSSHHIHPPLLSITHPPFIPYSYSQLHRYQIGRYIIPSSKGDRAGFARLGIRIGGLETAFSRRFFGVAFFCFWDGMGRVGNDWYRESRGNREG